jgi:uncharacterized protein YdaU (DUF1376 family)
MRRPWMPLYIADYLADTAHLGTLESGAYLHLIMHYWLKDGLPDDDAQLARIVKLSLPEWREIRSTIYALFGEGWSHPRIDKEISEADAKYERRATAGAAGARAKWGAGVGTTTRSERLAAARKVATHTPEEWKAMLAVFGGCVKCGLRHEQLYGGECCKDHVIPVFSGGSDGIENIQPLCRGCNSTKSSGQTDYRSSAVPDWREQMEKRLANAKQPQQQSQKEDGGGDAKPAPLVSREAIELSNELAVISGHDLKFIPPGWCGAPMRVMMWMVPPYSWSRDAMIAGARAAMARKTDGPPSSINYFEKPISRIVAQLAAPVQTVEVTANAPASANRAGEGWKQSRDDFRQARGKLKARIANHDRAADGGGEGDGSVARLPAPAGRGKS